MSQATGAEPNAHEASLPFVHTKRSSLWPTDGCPFYSMWAREVGAAIPVELPLVQVDLQCDRWRCEHRHAVVRRLLVRPVGEPLDPLPEWRWGHDAMEQHRGTLGERSLGLKSSARGNLYNLIQGGRSKTRIVIRVVER